MESVLTNDGQKKGQHAKMQVSIFIPKKFKNLILVNFWETSFSGFYGKMRIDLQHIATLPLQVVRMRLDEKRRIVGTLIPASAMDQLVKTLGQGAEESEEVIH